MEGLEKSYKVGVEWSGGCYIWVVIYRNGVETFGTLWIKCFFKSCMKPFGGELMIWIILMKFIK